jgi:hypothetical protein
MHGSSPGLSGLESASFFVDNKRNSAKLRVSMRDFEKLTPGVSAHDTATRAAAAATVPDSAGAINDCGKDGAAPKKHRKKSAAWQRMISIVANARWGSGG